MKKLLRLLFIVLLKRTNCQNTDIFINKIKIFDELSSIYIESIALLKQNINTVRKNQTLSTEKRDDFAFIEAYVDATLKIKNFIENSIKITEIIHRYQRKNQHKLESFFYKLNKKITTNTNEIIFSSPKTYSKMHLYLEEIIHYFNNTNYIEIMTLFKNNILILIKKLTYLDSKKSDLHEIINSIEEHQEVSQTIKKIKKITAKYGNQMAKILEYGQQEYKKYEDEVTKIKDFLNFVEEEPQLRKRSLCCPRNATKINQLVKKLREIYKT
jgi:hypothetical protein